MSATVFTVREAAERLQAHPQTVLAMIRRGKLQAIRIGTGPRPTYQIEPATLQAVSRTETGPAPATSPAVPGVDHDRRPAARLLGAGPTKRHCT